MIFVPLAPAQLRTMMADGGLGELVGFTATTALRQAHGLGPADDEQADFVAFGYAEAAAVALAVEPVAGRTVVVLDVETTAARPDDALGRVAVGRLRWSEVIAVYRDEPGALELVGTVRTATAGLDDEDAYGDPGMQMLLEDHDLLWHLPSEVAH